MSAADLFPTIHSLPREEKLKIFHFLAEELEERYVEPLPEGFPPPEDQCPYTREELEESRRQPGRYHLSEIWRRLGRS
ncbi:MAG TPA: hypothetical protein VGI40_28485 [Pirellulaceae bacterium]|jgi:hypothetical protein